MKRVLLLLTFVASTMSLSAQSTKQIDIGADEIVTLWDNSTAKYSNHMEKDEKVVSKRKFYNTSSADLYIFHPKTENKTGVSIVIYPGGSYRYAGFSTHFINWCKENGICEQTCHRWQKKIFGIAKAKHGVQFAIIHIYRCPNIHSGSSN